MNRKGFTLVELLATLVILGIVAGITIVSVSGIFKSTKDKSEDVFVDTIKDTMDMYLSSDAKKLSFDSENICSNTISKTHGVVSVYKGQFQYKDGEEIKYRDINFGDVINSEFKPITEKDLVNPANEEVDCGSVSDITVNIYRDDDFVYYYSIDKDEFAENGGISCLLNDENREKGKDKDGNPIYYSSVITNLPEGFECE